MIYAPANSKLGDHLSFKNGKASPVRVEEGDFEVFGSNGVIGCADSFNSSGPLIVIGRVGSYCGSLRYSARNAWVTDNAIVCTAKDPRESRFWFFALRTLSLNSRSSGSGQPLLNQSILSSIEVNVPPSLQRCAIADVLGALDDKIVANRKLVSAIDETTVLQMQVAGQERTVIAEVVEHNRRTRNPESMGSGTVAHYSLPSFDEGGSPSLDDPAAIKSAKFGIERPSVLISKLNPRFPRVWDVPKVGPEPAYSSTEFLVLEPRYCSTSVLWALLREPAVSMQLESKVAGTSGSHQRVKPADLLATEIIDPRSLPHDVLDAVTDLGRLRLNTIEESRTLAATRDALLPRLMSGELRVRDAERQVEEVL